MRSDLSDGSTWSLDAYDGYLYIPAAFSLLMTYLHAGIYEILSLQKKRAMTICDYTKCSHKVVTITSLLTIHWEISILLCATNKGVK